MRTDCEKGEALFERYRKQTDQENEQERLTYVRRLRAHYEDDPVVLRFAQTSLGITSKLAVTQHQDRTESDTHT